MVVLVYCQKSHASYKGMGTSIDDFTTEELQEELERRAQAGHHRRQARIFRGEIEDFTDGDQHIEEGIASGRDGYWGRGAANY